MYVNYGRVCPIFECADKVSSPARQNKNKYSFLTEFSDFILQGDIPQSVKPFFLGATLIPLRKKDGGIRPIAVGQTLRRLVSKCVSS